MAGKAGGNDSHAVGDVGGVGTQGDAMAVRAVRCNGQGGLCGRVRPLQQCFRTVAAGLHAHADPRPTGTGPAGPAVALSRLGSAACR